MHRIRISGVFQIHIFNTKGHCLYLVKSSQEVYKEYWWKCNLNRAKDMNKSFKGWTVNYLTNVGNHSISLLIISLFRFSISSWFSFVYFVSRNLSIGSRLSNLLAHNFSQCLLIIPLYFCGGSCYFPSLIYDFVQSSFYLDESS